MKGWRIHRGLALALPQAYVDTDQLIPARFMSRARAQGYGPYLFHDVRRDANGALREEFALNRHPDASVLVARHGFGSGSSREAAVYALVDAGFCAVIAPGFSDIFAANAVNNGLLPACVSDEDHAKIESSLEKGPKSIVIDIETRNVSIDQVRAAFTLDESWATKLMNGWDDIDLTRKNHAAIAAFKETRSQTAPWVWPNAAD